MIKRTDIKAHASQPHTLSSRTSQRTNQSLPKSVSVPTHDQKDRQTSGRKEARLPNIGFAKWRVQCFYDSLVQGSRTFVLKIRHFAKPKTLAVIVKDDAENKSV
jgi:hypothetical protein